MITKETIDKIIETARVEEVVGEFVTLRKRGVNLQGLCPFHNEKTPSFNVSPSKGIYKCFGCGKAGNAVTFLMEHEHYTYPEALKYLAKKYHIEIEEDERTESKEEQTERESLYLVSAFAQKHFSDILYNHHDGKAIGLTYFKERKFTEETIRKFQLGYSLNEWHNLTEAVLKAGYNADYLVKTGLSIKKRDEGRETKDDGNSQSPISNPQSSNLYDRFRGRVMFPIHNLSGRVIGFGGRILKPDVKSPKYLNSPESEIYHKSNVLYGIYFAKKEIITQDNCYLVEGYTDVISLHQSGIENVVASSGTSLTIEQIRLIGRYTKNVTVLYDGDAAGIKASLRGIDLILEEGLNVKVVLFPDGDDPDSFSHKVSSFEFKEFISQNAKDFIVFKTNLLLKDVANDPVRKAGLIHDIVETIAKIPDNIICSTYLKQCSALMEINEQVLIAEFNKAKRKAAKKQVTETDTEELLVPIIVEQEQLSIQSTEHQERDIIRLLLHYGNAEITLSNELTPDNSSLPTPNSQLKVAQFIMQELLNDSIGFDNNLYGLIFKEFAEKINQNIAVNEQDFINHPNKEICRLAVDLLSSPHELSENWEKIHGISVPKKEHTLKDDVFSSVYALKIKKVQKMRDEIKQKLKNTSSEEEKITLMQTKIQLDSIMLELGKIKGIVIVK